MGQGRPLSHENLTQQKKTEFRFIYVKYLRIKDMKIEHFAINVEDPLAMATWYVENMGLSIIRQDQEAPFMNFLADNSGKIMLEIYKNPEDQVPDYRKMDPLILHLAFVSESPDRDRKRLEKAGALVISEDKFKDGTHLIMMRDPWGLSIQLCKRGVPLLK